MLFHLLLNSFIVFIVLTVLIELFLSIFKVEKARTRYLLRLLPILKFPFDLLMFSFLDENLFVNFNPFSCQVYMHEFITSFAHNYIQNTSAPAEHFIIPQYLASYIPNKLLNVTILSMVSISFIIILIKIYLFLQARSDLKKIFDSSSLCTRPICNLILLEKVKEGKISVRTSNVIHIPFAANLSDIFLPQYLIEELTNEEFESVIAHELEHLRWKDPLVKMACDLFCAVFWWLPSTWWLNRLELEQEDACDAEVYKYGIDVIALGNAIIKIVKQANYKNYRFAAISTFDTPKNSHARRMNSILNLKNNQGFYWHSTLGILACFFAALCFWMC